ncbi:MarR family transcriptional regulator [Streptomyces sp. NPDC048845]|uniref:LexA family protein n=1 Tax=Streptomyces sp. NPDC048845 TaxID=3155390 RepID=UPI00341DD919
MNRPPTERQEQILRTLCTYVADHGEGPSVRELAALVGLFSTGSVAYHLGRLEEQGLISRSGHRWRTLRLGG